MSSNDESCDEDDRVEEGVIVPIQQSDVRRIVAGQAITDMTGAVKELVDNALDAGARNINVRLFNQGLDVIEVSDDGDGVPKHSRSLMAMKHATSKLSAFEELYQTAQLPNGTMQLRQLGFRGEALFSIANISQLLVVSTRTKDEQIGEKMEFRRDGYRNPSSVHDITRKVGTTVAAVKLFDALPVRRADLIKRIKQQKAKLLKLVQEYGVLCVGVKFNVYDITGPVGSPGSKTEIKLSTSEKSKSIKETISAVFGSRFLGGLCPLHVDLGDIVKKNSVELSSASAGNQEDDVSIWRIEGLISKAPSLTSGGKGHFARDIQMFCINGRPVDIPKFSRVVAEVWRSFDSGASSKKRPACIVGLYLPNDMFDINLAPDKRQVMMSDENIIFEQLKIELNRLWSKQTEGQFTINEADTSDRISKSDIVKNGDDDIEKASIKRSRDDGETSDTAQDLKPGPNKKSNLGKTKMKRRNACVHSFDNIGKATTDYSLGIPTHLPYRTSHTEASSHPALSPGEESMEEEEEEFDLKSSSIEKDTLPKQAQDTTYVRDDTADNEDEVVRRLSVSCSIGSTSATRGDRARWDESKLNFNNSRTGSFSSQREEIDALDAMKPHKKTDTLSNEEIGGNPSKVRSEKSPSRQLNLRSAKSKQLSMTSFEALKQFSFSSSKVTRSAPLRGPSGQKDDENDESAHNLNMRSLISPSRIGRKIPSPPQVPVKNLSEIKRRHTRDPPARVTKIMDQSEDDLTTDEITSEKDSKERTYVDDSNDLASNSKLSSSVVDSEKITWESFQSTANVIRHAETAHLERQKTRSLLERIRTERVELHESSTGENKQTLGDNLPDDNGQKVSLTKEDFLTMQVIGQFNLGFILATCEKGHLWILDQHACDEIYNFERLCVETKLHEQKLIAPLPIELSPSEENCVIDNMEAFERNGFRFAYDSEKPPRHRLSLVAIPHSGSGGDGKKAVQFGADDVGALCAMLGADGASSSSGLISGSGTGADGSGASSNNAVRRYAGGALGGSRDDGAIIRLPKAIAMFASRACRSSVMIGDPLSEEQMSKIVMKLQKVDQPWNCPHGRPTILHVSSLLDRILEDEGRR